MHYLSIFSLLFAGVSAFEIQQAFAGSAPSCNSSTISCHWQGSVDSCCSPVYGLVVFTLQWMPGSGPENEFTIHGLWPNTCSNGRAPGRGCDRTRIANNIGPIVRSADPEVYRQLQTLWPSYKGDNNWFWSHEWNKHGTCVSTLRPTCFGDAYVKYQDVVAYFKQALELHHDYDVYGVLNVAGIFPGRTYHVDTMVDALQKSFGAKVKIDCNRSGQITEVGLSFYVQGRDGYQITDAPQQGTCRGQVWYPKKY